MIFANIARIRTRLIKILAKCCMLHFKLKNKHLFID